MVSPLSQPGHATDTVCLEDELRNTEPDNYKKHEKEEEEFIRNFCLVHR
jgi:hypothetical protein